ncbi:MAG: cell division topological specificity factor MinE [Eubacteriales bacterium]
MKFFNGNHQINSKDVAKKRLKTLLSYERNQISGEMLDLLKSEIIQCVQDYYPIDREGCEVFITEEKNDDSAIVAILPITKGFK